MELRIVQFVAGLTLLLAVVAFTVFPQLKPDWIQIGHGRDRGDHPPTHRQTLVTAESSDEQFNEGIEHLEREQWDQAIAKFTAVLRRHPSDDDAYYLRGTAWVSQEQFEKAIADFDAAIRLKPDHADALYSRADVRETLGETKAALADINAAIRLVPEDVDYFCLRGRLHEDSGDFRQALTDLELATRLAPDDSLALNNLAWLLATAPVAELRDGARAMKLATSVVEIDEAKGWESLDTFAAACAEAGKFDAAVKCQTESIRLAPPEEHAALKERLELYRAQKPYRQPGLTR